MIDPDRDALAAEYLLGLLDGAERRAVAEAAEADPELAAAIAAWGTRLEPLGALAAPVQPSDMLWARIRRDLPGGAPRTVSPRPNAWRALAIASSLVAACLCAALLLSGHHLDVQVAWDSPMPRRVVVADPALAKPAPAPPAPPAASAVSPAKAPATVADKAPPKPAPAQGGAVALLTASGSERPAMKAFLAPDRTVRLTAIQPVSVPPGKALGFWVWPHGVARPILIGRLPPEGGSLRFPYGTEDGTPVMVTIEPRDLPYTGEQGPTLFQGQIVLLN